MKKRVRGQVFPELYQEKKRELELLKKAESDGKIDLYFGDESGFSLVPCLPYGGRERGKNRNKKWTE